MQSCISHNPALQLILNILSFSFSNVGISKRNFNCFTSLTYISTGDPFNLLISTFANIILHKKKMPAVRALLGALHKAGLFPKSHATEKMKRISGAEPARNALSQKIRPKHQQLVLDDTLFPVRFLLQVVFGSFFRGGETREKQKILANSLRERSIRGGELARFE